MKNLRQTLILLVKLSCALLSFFITQIASALSQPYVTIPFTLHKNCIYFYAKVNGTDSIKFLFDTGADGSVINKLSINKLPIILDGKSINRGSNGVNEVESSSKNTIVLGDKITKTASFTIIPYDHTDFDGVFGTDLMKGYFIEIDYHKQLLLFYTNLEHIEIGNQYTKVKMQTQVYPTYIKSTLIANGKKYKGYFGLDTGADDPVTLAAPFSRKSNFGTTLKKIGAATFQGSDGSTNELPIVLMPEIRFAAKSLYHIPTALSNATEGIDATDDLNGFLGNAFLNKFNIILDYENNFIYFKLNKNLYKNFYE